MHPWTTLEQSKTTYEHTAYNIARSDWFDPPEIHHEEGQVLEKGEAWDLAENITQSTL